MRKHLDVMPTNDRGGATRPLGSSYLEEIGAHAIGCLRCASTCGFLDDCAVCRGEVICARCLFGVRVDADEIHTTFVLEG